MRAESGLGTISAAAQLAINALILLGMGGAAFMWAWKLDARTEQLDKDVSKVEGQIERGILPVTEERLKADERRITDLEERMTRHEQQTGMRP